MIPILRKHFKDNVTFISAMLHHYFPKQYFFYRVSKLEKEIFKGLEFFKEVVPEFAGLRFPGVSRTGFDRYLKLNEALLNSLCANMDETTLPRKLESSIM